MKSRDISALEETLGYRFRHPELIQQALTHSSQAREMETAPPGVAARMGDNGQLEFVGDAVLALGTGRGLFQRFPGCRGGELSNVRRHLVICGHLIRVAQ